MYCLLIIISMPWLTTFWRRVFCGIPKHPISTHAYWTHNGHRTNGYLSCSKIMHHCSLCTYLQLISIHAYMPIIYTNNCAKNQKLYLRSVTLCIWSFSEHILKHSTTLQAWLSTLGKRTSHMYRWVHACLGLYSTTIFTFNMENCCSCSQKGRQMQLLSSAA